MNVLSRIDDAIDTNSDLVDAILDLALASFNLAQEPEPGEYNWHGCARPSDMAKAHSTVRQFWRDWSASGFLAEVGPLLHIVRHDLESLFPPSNWRSLRSGKPCLLLPGAGLGRMLFELCNAGYDVEGNEISYHQLFASNFILNATQHAEQYNLFPFVTTFSNHLSRDNQMACFSIPDVHPSTEIAQHLQNHQHPSTSASVPPGSMNMTAGDFITSYSTRDSKDSFDAVVTIYFIDTAPNLIRYIETVMHCLRDKGVWINIGPLLWHFDERMTPSDLSIGNSEKIRNDESIEQVEMEDTGIGEPGSFELTDEEVVAMLDRLGFEILVHELLPAEKGGYIQDLKSMMQSRYRCSHWVARKKKRGER